MSKLCSLPALLFACLIGCTLLTTAAAQTTASNEWTWMGGSNTVPFSGSSQPGVYGTLGAAAAGNIPESSEGAASWTDADGNLWLFGGGGGATNALWEFNPSTSQWAWMGGGSSNAVYGALGVSAAGNTPGNAESPVNWVDKNGSFWLFGGAGTNAELNQLWEFNPSTNEWAWMGGNSTISCTNPTNSPYCAQQGVYGTLGSPAAGNIPMGRTWATSWTDSSGNLWLFGGWGANSNGQGIYLNDLWEFSPSTNQWAWMGGSNPADCVFRNVNSFCTPAGTYGSLGAPAAGNLPPGRYGAMGWADSSGNFWLFGGSVGAVGYSNDLWEFTPSTGQWAWMGGSGTSTSFGTYGTLGKAATGNFPGARSSSSGWTDTSGNLWLYGGFGFDSAGNNGYLDDLWKLTPSTNEWTWMGGSSTLACVPSKTSNATVCYEDGVYGTQGAPATGNSPGSRGFAANWTDDYGNLWLFGGWGYGANGTGGYFNDMWEYQPYPNAALPVLSVGTGSYSATQNVKITDATPNVTIFYTTDGSKPTTKSAVYTGSITISSSETLQAIATAPNYVASSVASADYIILPPAATPTFSLSQGTYNSTQSVTISDATGGAAIYYTTDGTTPTTSSALYSAPITVTVTETLEAMAAASGYSDSPVASAAYTIAPGFAVSGKAVTVTAGATTGNTSTVSITPVGGFTGSVALTAAVTSSPSGAVVSPTLSFGATTPVSITGTAAGTATLTISTTAASSEPCTAMNRNEPGIGWKAGGGAVLACLLLFGIPMRRRKLHGWLGMLILLLAFAGATIGCGGSGSSGKACPALAIAGTTAGSYTITVTATSGSVTQTSTVALTVQ